MIAYAFFMTLLVGVFIGANGILYFANYMEKREARLAAMDAHPSNQDMTPAFAPTLLSYEN